MISVTEAEIDRECEREGIRRDQAYRLIKARRIIKARAREIPKLCPIAQRVIDVSDLPEFKLAAEHLRLMREKSRD